MKRVVLDSFQQMEHAECGPASIKILLSHFKSYISISTAKSFLQIGRDGSSARQICEASSKLGLSLLPLSVSFQEITDEVDAPYIMFWGANHWLVVEGYENGYLYVSDPAKGRVRYSKKTVESYYSDLILYPTDFDSRFRKNEKIDSNLNLLKLLSSYKTSITVAALLSLFSVVPELSISLLLGRFAQLVATNMLDEDILSNSWFLLLVTGFFAMFTALIFGLYRLINKSLSLNLSRIFISQLIKAPLLFFSVRSTGELGSRLTQVTSICAEFSNNLLPGILTFARALIAITICILINPYLGLFILVFFTLASASVVYFARNNIRDSAVSDIYNSKCFGILVDIIRSSELVKSTGTESTFFQNWASNFSQFISANQSIAITNATISTIISGTQYVLNVGLLFLAAFLIMNGQIDLATYTAFLYVSSIVGFSLSMVPGIVSSSAFIGGFKWRLNDLMDITDDRTSSFSSYQDNINSSEMSDSSALASQRNSTADSSPNSHILEINNLSFRYPGTEKNIFENLDYRFPSSGITSITGPSGCGKSTLVKIIAGLIPANEGTVWLDDKSITEIPNNQKYYLMSYVSQDPFLFDGSLLDNITMKDPLITPEAVRKACSISGLIDKLKISTDTSTFHVKSRGINLSGGQRQLIEITRALARNPKVLILDEATSGFDNQLEEYVLSNLLKLDITILSIAHRKTALDYSSSIIDISKLSSQIY